MMRAKLILVFCAIQLVFAKKNMKSLQDQFCTDPRTQEKHVAYSEWSDAYSCTRHRCQPSGRNLAIYTVGCKKVDPPESAIECEEVVEDTNMQFPYCCSRLRCLVVVRGEVWTKVLGQPWETLPAAPWSHMYKMKKPAPGHQMNNGDSYNMEPQDTQLNEIKNDDPKLAEGPVYELGDTVKDDMDMPAPKTAKNKVNKRKFKSDLPKTTPTSDMMFLQDSIEEKSIDAIHLGNENDNELSAENDNLSDTQILNDMEQLVTREESQYKAPAAKPATSKRSKLQELVDAIGDRMRDIENVVHRMREKVYVNNMQRDDSGEKDMRGPPKVADHLRQANKHKKNKVKKSSISKIEDNEIKAQDFADFVQDQVDFPTMNEIPPRELIPQCSCKQHGQEKTKVLLEPSRNITNIEEPQKSLYMAPVTAKKHHGPRKNRLDPRKRIKTNKRKPQPKKRASFEYLESDLESASKE